MFFTDDIAIDLGTTYSVVASRNQSRPKFLRIPSSIAIDSESNKVVAFGEDAREARGRQAGRLKVIPPVERGVISRLDLIQDYLDFLVGFEESAFGFIKNIYLCAPWGATPVELQAYLGCFRRPRTHVSLIREPFAAALGAGLDPYSQDPITVADIGGGTFEISTIQKGHMVHCSSIRFAGVALDQMIETYLREQKDLLIGMEQAEFLKIHHLQANPVDHYRFPVSGHCRFQRKPLEIEVSSIELSQAIEKGFRRFEEAIRRHFQALPRDLEEQTRWQGIYLSGGGSLLGGLADRFSDRLHIDVKPVSDPLYSVIRGMLKVVETPRAYREILSISEKVAEVS